MRCEISDHHCDAVYDDQTSTLVLVLDDTCMHTFDADRERVGIVGGDFRPASRDEAVDAAECAGEDDEGANGEGEPGMTAAEAAQA